MQLKLSSRGVDAAILVSGVCWLIFILSLRTSRGDETYLGQMRGTGYYLLHGHFGDLTQDVVGFRAICRNEDPYPILGPVYQKIGIIWDLKHSSTHPPTAFLLVSPVGWLSINTGAIVWGWMMIACLIASFFCMGCNAWRAVGLGLLSLGWPPAAMCLGQLTAIWLLAVCAAYRICLRFPAFSSALIGIAAATKLAPAMLLVLLWRKLKSLVGFAAVWVVLIGILLALCPSSINRYLQVNKHEVPHQFGRPDNGSIAARATHVFGGKMGRLLTLGFLAVVVLTNVRAILAGGLVGWSVMSYLAVASLPIFWIYSTVPLLFLGQWALRNGWIAKIFFFGFILATTVLHTWNSPAVLALTVVWLGIGMAITGLIGQRDASIKTERIASSLGALA